MHRKVVQGCAAVMTLFSSQLALPNLSIYHQCATYACALNFQCLEKKIAFSALFWQKLFKLSERNFFQDSSFVNMCGASPPRKKVKCPTPSRALVHRLHIHSLMILKYVTSFLQAWTSSFIANVYDKWNQCKNWNEAHNDVIQRQNYHMNDRTLARCYKFSHE